MPQRVGVDLASVAAVREAIATHGQAYLSRVFTDRELRDCGEDPTRLAGRFAAKEAVLKVLRPAIDTALPWTHIEVVRDPDGYVEVSLAGLAADRATDEGLSGFSVSLSHEGEVACAVVSCEIAAPIGPPARDETCRCQPA